MKVLLSALLTVGLLSSPLAWADARSTCEKGALDRKLTGAARDAHMQKCMKDGGAAEAALQCERSVSEKKVHDSLKESLIRQCIAELVAPNR